MDDLTDIKYEPCDTSKSLPLINNLINKCYYVILSKEDLERREEKAYELFAMKSQKKLEEKFPGQGRKANKGPDDDPEYVANYQTKPLGSNTAQFKASKALKERYAAEDKLEQDRKARAARVGKFEPKVKTKEEQDEDKRRSDYVDYLRGVKDKHFKKEMDYVTWLEAKREQRKEDVALAKSLSGGGQLWWVKFEGGVPQKLSEGLSTEELNKWKKKGTIYTSYDEACEDVNAICGGGGPTGGPTSSAEDPIDKWRKRNTPPQGDPKKSHPKKSDLEESDSEESDSEESAQDKANREKQEELKKKRDAELEQEREKIQQDVTQKLAQIKVDKNTGGRFIFLFKLDIDESNEFNNKHIFDNACAGNIPGEGDYVRGTNWVFGGTDYIIKQTFFDQNLDIYAICRPVNMETLEESGGLVRYPLNQLQKILTWQSGPGMLTGQIDKLLGKKPITEKRVVPIEPIKSINGLLLDLDELQGMINNPPNPSIFDYLAILERYVRENYGDNGTLLINVLRKSIQSRTLDKLLFLLLNKFDYNVFGNKDFDVGGMRARDAEQAGDMLRDTMDNDLPRKLYLNIFLKIMNIFTYFSGRQIIYKTAKLTKIRNGTCNILLYDTQNGNMPVMELTNFTIFENDYNQIINLDETNLMNIQSSLAIETIYEKIIRYTLLYFAHSEYHTFTNCEKIEYYNVFKSSIQTVLSLFKNDKLVKKTAEERAERNRQNWGKYTSNAASGFSRFYKSTFQQPAPSAPPGPQPPGPPPGPPQPPSAPQGDKPGDKPEPPGDNPGDNPGAKPGDKPEPSSEDQASAKPDTGKTTFASAAETISSYLPSQQTISQLLPNTDTVAKVGRLLTGNRINPSQAQVTTADPNVGQSAVPTEVKPARRGKKPTNKGGSVKGLYSLFGHRKGSKKVKTKKNKYIKSKTKKNKYIKSKTKKINYKN